MKNVFRLASRRTRLSRGRVEFPPVSENALHYRANLDCHFLATRDGGCPMCDTSV